MTESTTEQIDVCPAAELPSGQMTLVEMIDGALGPDFDVIWEAQGLDNEHLHVEYDPKEPY